MNKEETTASVSCFALFELGARKAGPVVVLSHAPLHAGLLVPRPRARRMRPLVAAGAFPLARAVVKVHGVFNAARAQKEPAENLVAVAVPIAVAILVTAAAAAAASCACSTFICIVYELLPVKPP